MTSIPLRRRKAEEVIKRKIRKRNRYEEREQYEKLAGKGEFYE